MAMDDDHDTLVRMRPKSTLLPGPGTAARQPVPDAAEDAGAEDGLALLPQAGDPYETAYSRASNKPVPTLRFIMGDTVGGCPMPITTASTGCLPISRGPARPSSSGLPASSRGKRSSRAVTWPSSTTCSPGTGLHGCGCCRRGRISWKQGPDGHHRHHDQPDHRDAGVRLAVAAARHSSSPKNPQQLSTALGLLAAAGRQAVTRSTS